MSLSIHADHPAEVHAEFERLKEQTKRAAKCACRAQERIARAQHEAVRSEDDLQRRYAELTAFVAAHPPPQMEMFAA